MKWQFSVSAATIPGRRNCEVLRNQPAGSFDGGRRVVQDDREFSKIFRGITNEEQAERGKDGG